MSCVLNGGAPSLTSTALLFPCGESSAHILSGKKNQWDMEVGQLWFRDIYGVTVKG